MNRVILSGNLTRDPEVRYTQSGKAYARLSIAVTRTFNKDQTDFFSMTAWDKQAEFCGRYLEKGSRVIVEGRVENNNYEKDGVKHYTDQIVIDRIEFGDSKKSGGGGSRNAEPENEFVDDGDSGDGGDIDVPF